MNNKMSMLRSWWYWIKACFYGIRDYDPDWDNSRSDLIYKLKWQFDAEYWTKTKITSIDKRWDNDEN